MIQLEANKLERCLRSASLKRKKWSFKKSPSKLSGSKTKEKIKSHRKRNIPIIASADDYE